MNRVARPTLLRNLQIGFGLSLLILIVTSIASWSSIRNLMDGSRLVDHTDSTINELNMTLATLTEAETGQRGFLLTGDTSFLRPYYGAYDRALAMVDRIQAMTVDNPLQQQNARELREVVAHRLSLLQEIITQKQTDNIFSLEDLRNGRGYMNEARSVVLRMQEEEHRLLLGRLDKVRRFSTYTPVLIVVAALLSILITVFFYTRVYNDYLERNALYAELMQKEQDVSRRIEIIGGIAEDISAGKYQTRVGEDQSGALGILSTSLNKMAESLEYSFGLLSDKEWLQTGIARLNEEMVGEVDMHNLVSNVIAFLTEYSRSSVGALYILDPVTRVLTLRGRYALGAAVRKEIKSGEGLIGQVAASGKTMLLKDVPPSDWVLSIASGDIRPTSIIAFPFIYERKVRGVIELGSLDSYTALDQEFFRSVSENIGAAVHSIESRLRLQELLEETQAQAEELKSQHTELETLNLELEVQAEKLQVSEEELKVQQEELMQTNQELEERSRSLEEKNQLVLIRNLDIQKKAEDLMLSTKYKSEFMANMSHELRTPLNSILLLSRLLVENGGRNLSEDQIEYARVIQNSGQGLLQLIDEILDLSRIESGKLPLEHSIVPVADVLEDMRQLFEPIAKDKNLDLHIVTEEGTPAQLETDKLRLEQILKNLLANAFKFTQRGFVTLRVAPSPTRKNFIHFAVRDSGIGIPEDKHQLIFEAFQQADGSTRRKYGGTGLGLSISRELSKLLGGEISLESNPGEGTEFTVSVPQFRMEPAARNTPPEAQAAQAPVFSEGSLFTLSDVPAEIPDDRNDLQPDDKVLLIVEDDTLFAQSLLDFTHKKGYKAIVAVSGDAGIQMARRYRPMGILLDIQLPVKSGWDVMDELKRNPQTRSIPVHIMSSFEMRNESLMKGAVDFVSKQTLFGNMDEAFGKIEYWLNQNARKVLIVEDNIRHAQALAYFLSSHQLNMEIAATIQESVRLLADESVHGVILSRAVGKEELDALEMIRKDQALTNVPVIVLTGMNISRGEEARLRQFADSIVVKTAHSYQRVLDEVSLFLHVVSESQGKAEGNGYGGRLGGLDEVLKNKTVLVADDDVRNIFSLTKALEQHKMKVLSAMDGKEALQMAEEGVPDIILMDMMMPEMDGYEAISQIRKNPRLRNLPVIAVTAKAMTGDREKCIQAGASDYISKPVDVDQLLSLLRIWLYEK